MQKYSQPLARRPVTIVFWWGKTHTKVKRQGYHFVCVCDAVFLVSFLPCRTPPPDHVQCDGMKACQTISGLVRKTRGRLIIPWHVIGWNLKVCLLWQTGVESSIDFYNSLCPDLQYIVAICFRKSTVWWRPGASTVQKNQQNQWMT